jgi:hypothetical protein
MRISRLIKYKHGLILVAVMEFSVMHWLHCYHHKAVILCLDRTEQKIKSDISNVSLHFQKTDFEKHSFLEGSLSGILMANAIHYIKDKKKIYNTYEKLSWAGWTMDHCRI